jgi:hypothetical protein
LSKLKPIPVEDCEGNDALIALLKDIYEATDNRLNAAMKVRSGARGSLLEKHFPKLHAKAEDGSSLWSELQKGNFKGVYLETDGVGGRRTGRRGGRGNTTRSLSGCW